MSVQTNNTPVTFPTAMHMAATGELGGAIFGTRTIGEPLKSYATIGSDEHRVEMARWAIETFAQDTQLYKQAAKVLANYLGGKPLPGGSESD